MLSSEVLKLETENQELKEMLKMLSKGVPKPKDCRHCRNYIQYYCRDHHGNFRTIYAGIVFAEFHPGSVMERETQHQKTYFYAMMPGT